MTDHLKEELGDLLLQVVLHAQIAGKSNGLISMRSPMASATN